MVFYCLTGALSWNCYFYYCMITFFTFNSKTILYLAYALTYGDCRIAIETFLLKYIINKSKMKLLNLIFTLKYTKL